MGGGALGTMSNQPHPITVAIVEDEPVLREEMAFQLRHLGFAVQAFACAAQFYRHLAVQPVTVAVLDIGLDGEDGLAICQYLRRHDRQLGIVFVTARGLRDDRLSGLAAGADAYLVKPIDIDELVLILKRLSARAEFLRPVLAAAPAEEQRPKARPERAPDLATATATAWQLLPEAQILVAPNQQHIQLSINEAQLLGVLLERINQTCTHRELGLALGLHAEEFDKHRIEVILSRLRNKVHRLSGLRLPLVTQRGHGYFFGLPQ